MSILCYLGVHRWDYDERVAVGFVTYLARCRRSGCTRHADWRVVHKEKT